MSKAVAQFGLENTIGNPWRPEKVPDTVSLPGYVALPDKCIRAPGWQLIQIYGSVFEHGFFWLVRGAE